MTRLIHIALAALLAASFLVIPASEGAETVLCIEPSGALNVERVWLDGACSGCEEEDASPPAIFVDIAPVTPVDECGSCLDIPISGDTAVAAAAPVAGKRIPDAPPVLPIMPCLAALPDTQHGNAPSRVHRPPLQTAPTLPQLAIWRC